MKTLTCSIICAAVVAAFNFSSFAVADSVVVTHEAWTHDHDGYWDNHGERHAYIEREHHHGFWRENPNGNRVFINID